MRAATFQFVMFLGGLLIIGSVAAQDLIVFPKEGQNQEQIEKDKYACHVWAKQQTGFDPMQAAPSPQTASDPASTTGGAVRGAARGALLGVTVGAIAGDAGKGAGMGAAAGGLLGGMRSADQRRQQQKAVELENQQQTAAHSQKRDAYNRACGACLEAKGYTVK